MFILEAHGMLMMLFTTPIMDTHFIQDTVTTTDGVHIMDMLISTTSTYITIITNLKNTVEVLIYIEKDLAAVV